MLLLKSTPKSIKAEVAIKVSIVNPNEVKVIPLIAPPVPIKPAISPEKIPPKTEFFIVGLSIICLKNKNVRLVIIKKQASIISNILELNKLLK